MNEETARRIVSEVIGRLATQSSSTRLGDIFPTPPLLLAFIEELTLRKLPLPPFGFTRKTRVELEEITADSTIGEVIEILGRSDNENASLAFSKVAAESEMLEREEIFLLLTKILRIHEGMGAVLREISHLPNQIEYEYRNSLTKEISRASGQIRDLGDEIGKLLYELRTMYEATYSPSGTPSLHEMSQLLTNAHSAFQRLDSLPSHMQRISREMEVFPQSELRQAGRNIEQLSGDMRRLSREMASVLDDTHRAYERILSTDRGLIVHFHGHRAPKTHSLIRVFYATDRAEMQTQRVTRYGSERSVNGQLHYGECDISVPVTHEIGKLESPCILKCEFIPDPKRHIILRSVESMHQERFFGNVADSVAKAPAKDALVFVHGYNVSFEDAARRNWPNCLRSQFRRCANFL